MQAASIFRTFAEYNSWINLRLITALSPIAKTERDRLQNSFYEHVVRILNHNLVVDILWLHRFRNGLNSGRLSASLEEVGGYEMPIRLHDMMYETLEDFSESRTKIDNLISMFIKKLSDDDLSQEILFSTIHDSTTLVDTLGNLLLHQFNHQTSHRGDILSTMMTMGIDVGNNDLMAILKPASYSEAERVEAI